MPCMPEGFEIVSAFKVPAQPAWLGVVDVHRCPLSTPNYSDVSSESPAPRPGFRVSGRVRKMPPTEAAKKKSQQMRGWDQG